MTLQPRTVRCVRLLVVAASLLAAGNQVTFAQPAATVDAWRTMSERTRAGIWRMEHGINFDRTNPASRNQAYEAYMASFSPQVVVHGMIPAGDLDLQGVRRFYAALFGAFGGSSLVSDELIVAGPMAAQRYHALGRMTGTFDGVKLDNRLVGLRGKTFFRLDPDGRIAERWSNHDHGYRMSMTLGPEGAAEGDRLARHLNGPGLTESEVYERLDAFAAAFNLAHLPEQREQRVLALFEGSARIHGIGTGPVDLTGLRDHLRTQWAAMPDLVMLLEAKLSTWSMGAVRWRATGSRRQPLDGQPGDWAPVKVLGETIVRYAGNGRIAEMWLHQQAPQLLAPEGHARP